MHQALITSTKLLSLDKSLLREVLMTYYYCTPKKEFAGKVLMDTLRKRWLNEPIGVPEDANDLVFLGLKNGKNQEQYAIYILHLVIISRFLLYLIIPVFS